ncbi:NDR1/HIN1-like protein 13 [Papaver somniferum]|uniref:NDR1/HIN1-like protein 13 n=1 Tax=Papaver somniferum TaxID=3469 RepID=UPI000E6FD3D7|nr:NDR1/HIN1-like protein 13 [Papaver somniferum]
MDYTIESISIKGINLTFADNLLLSPEFDINISYANPNKNMGFYYYEIDSHISISYSTAVLCSSGNVLPTFYQPKNNVTVLETVSRCSGVKVTPTIRDSLLRDQRKSKIRLSIDMSIPIRSDTEAVETTASSILKVYCDVKVDKLALDSKIVSEKCILINKPWASTNYQNKGLEVSDNKLARASY